MSLPAPPAAVLRALDFSEPRTPRLTDREWQQALGFLDRNQVTPLFPSEGLPATVAQRIGRAARNNRARLAKLRSEYDAIAAAFDEAEIPHVLLKGFSHDQDFLPEPDRRPSYDLDILIPGDEIPRAWEIVTARGFESAGNPREGPTDHLAPLVRKTGWEWRGDLFDPEIPPVVELHYRLWDERTEGFPAPGVDAFWERREGARFAPLDRFGYASLHALRHLLRGALKLLHVYELASFLDRADERTFATWTEIHPPQLRRLTAISCRLAVEWFHPRVPAPLQEEIEALPASIENWFDRYAHAPIEAQLAPNKHELWLHLALLEGAAAKARVLRRRLFPARLPGPVEGQFGAKTAAWSRAVRFCVHVIRRGWNHAASLVSFSVEAIRRALT